jgi:hypothetical protein
MVGVVDINVVPALGYTEAQGLAEHYVVEVVAPGDVEIERLRTYGLAPDGEPCSLHSWESIGQRAQINVAAGGKLVESERTIERSPGEPISVEISVRAAPNGWLHRASITSFAISVVLFFHLWTLRDPHMVDRVLAHGTAPDQTTARTVLTGFLGGAVALATVVLFRDRESPLPSRMFSLVRWFAWLQVALAGLSVALMAATGPSLLLTRLLTLASWLLTLMLFASDQSHPDSGFHCRVRIRFWRVLARLGSSSAERRHDACRRRLERRHEQARVPRRRRHRNVAHGGDAQDAVV